MQNSTYGTILITTESQVKLDQQKPITKQRFVQIMQRINHPELLKEKKSFNKPFKDRLINIIRTADKQFMCKGKNFLINIYNARETLIQLVSSNLLVNSQIKGIGIHIRNDDTSEDYKAIKKRMSKISKDLDIQELKLDHIETYQKEYAFNEIELTQDIEMVISNVYKQNIEELDIDIYEV